MLTTILNPKSGSAGDNFRERVETALREAGAEYEILETTREISGKDLACKAVKDGARHLLACGGDGTVMSVVNGIGASGLATAQDKPQVTLSIIPGGTANLLAGALKIPTDLDEAVGIAVGGRDLALDLGLSGEHWFALGMGLGLTEKLVSQTSTKEKEVLGKLAYARAMLSELGMKPHNFTLKLDNKAPVRQSGVALVIANAGEIGGGLKFAPDAKMDDGALDVCILRRFYFRDVLRLIWRSLAGSVRDDRAVDFYKAKHIEIETDPPLDLQIDGEEVDKMIPLIADAVPHAILVRVPEEAENSDAFIQTPTVPSKRPIVLRAVVVASLVALGVYVAQRRKK